MTPNRIQQVKPIDDRSQRKLLGAVSALVIVASLTGCPPTPPDSDSDSALEQACIDSGGTVTTGTCNCEGTADFYDNCMIGGCTCPPEFPSFEVQVCDCGEGRCFDGTECVPLEEPDLEQACIDSGGTVTTGTCNCTGTADFYDNCMVGACTCPPEFPSFEVQVCDCGEGRCFDGTECVSWDDALEEE